MEKMMGGSREKIAMWVDGLWPDLFCPLRETLEQSQPGMRGGEPLSLEAVPAEAGIARHKGLSWFPIGRPEAGIPSPLGLSLQVPSPPSRGRKEQ